MSEHAGPGPLIDVRGVTRHYPGGVVALGGIDLTVESGEMIVVTGPSGCGKSTLLHLLAGIDSPSSGSVTVGGNDLAGVRDLSGYRRSEVGLVFQFHNLLPQLPAAANVELPMFGTHRSPAERTARALELLEAVDLAGCAHRLPTELSGGERQRVAIARALANEPRILLADEPTGSLDSVSTERFLALLHRLNGDGVTIVMVTHDAEVAAEAGREIAMRDGVVVAGAPVPAAPPPAAPPPAAPPPAAPPPVGPPPVGEAPAGP